MATFTEDVVATTTFYRRLFGKAEFDTESIAIFDVNGVDAMVHETDGENEGPLPPEDHFAFGVADLDGAFSDPVDEGVTVFREPAEFEWGRSGYLRDPDGRPVELTEKLRHGDADRENYSSTSISISVSSE